MALFISEQIAAVTSYDSGNPQFSVYPGENTLQAAASALVAEASADTAEGFALTLEGAAAGGYYESVAEGVADSAVAIGEAFNVIADGRHYVARKTAADAGEIVTEYNTTGVFPELAASGGAGLVGYIATGTGAVERTVQDKLRDIPTEEDFVDGTPRGFWTDTSPTGRVWRPLDRVMIGGAAIEASGLRDPGANKGWLGYEANGFMTYFETTSQFQSWAYQGGAAIIGASRSSDLPGNAFQGVPMGVGAYVTNDLNGAISMVWGHYVMAQRGVGVAGGAIGIETNVANRGAEVSVNPFNMAPAGLTAAAWFRTGGEVSESGLSVAAASLAVGITHDDSNANAKFLKGIVFQSGALKPNGAGNGIAIEMAKNHEMRWIRDGSGSRSGWVRSDASTSSTGLVFVNGGAAFQNEANQTAFLVNAAASSANYLRVDSIGAGASPAIIAEGSDTNIDLTLATKGSGVLRFGYWNTNADAPINGYIFIRDGYGNLRKLATIA